MKKNYTGNHLRAWIIAIDEQRVKHRLLYAEIYVSSNRNFQKINSKNLSGKTSII